MLHAMPSMDAVAATIRWVTCDVLDLLLCICAAVSTTARAVIFAISGLLAVTLSYQGRPVTYNNVWDGVPRANGRRNWLYITRSASCEDVLKLKKTL